VEHLVALYTDESKIISERVHRALLSIVDKDTKLVISRISDGVTLSYKFQAQVFGKCRPIEEVIMVNGDRKQESIYGKLYTYVKGTKLSRQGFLHSLVRLYETEAENILFLKYLTLIFAGLPFSLQEEPLYVIYHINRLITFAGASLLSTLKIHYDSSDDITEKISEIKQICGIICILRLKGFL